MDRVEKLLKEITEIPGPSGFEMKVADFVVDKMKGYYDEFIQDGLGSVILKKRGTSDSPRIMIAGHMDEVGFMVKGITKQGFIKFNPLGGWWSHNLLGQRVKIITSAGKEIIGVIGSKPPHALQPDERKKVIELDQLYIDIGVSEADPKLPEKSGIKVGDPIIPVSDFQIMADKKVYLAKAWDDRIGVAAMMETLRALKGREHPNVVFGVGTVQEEVGLRGATTAAYTIEPDIAIAVDVTLCNDTPGMPDAEYAEKMGKGPSISVMDGSIISNPFFKELIVETAEELKIPYQLGSLTKGGTDSGRIHISKQGVPSNTLSIATRYIHSHNSILHRDDFDNLVKLIVGVVMKLDKDTVERIRTKGR